MTFAPFIVVDASTCGLPETIVVRSMTAQAKALPFLNSRLARGSAKRLTLAETA